MPIPEAEAALRYLSSAGRAQYGLSGSVEELNPEYTRYGYEGAEGLDPGYAAQSRQALFKAGQEQRKLLRQAQQLGQTGQQIGFDMEGLQEATQQARQPRPIDENPSTLGKVFETLDLPARALRTVLTPGSRSWAEEWAGAKDSKEWHKGLNKAARRGHVGAGIAEAGKALVGKTIGTGVGTALALPGVVSDLVAGRGASLGRNAAKTIASTQKDVGNLGFDVLTDPLNLLPVGKAAKLVGKGIARVADVTPGVNKAMQAALGMGAVPIETALKGRRAISTAARQARGVHDVAMGREMLRAEQSGAIKSVETAKEAIESAEKVAAAESKAHLTAELARQFGPQLPTHAEQTLKRAFDSRWETASAFLHSQGSPALAKVAQAYEWTVGKIKTNVLSRSPSHHWVNVMNDTIQMFMGGVSDPTALSKGLQLIKGSGTLKTGRYGVLTAEQFREALQREGLGGGLGGLERLGYLGPETRDFVAKQLAQSKGVGQTGVGSKIAEGITGGWVDRLPGWMPTNAKFGTNWEAVAKGTMFADQLKKGATFEEAARHTANYLLDYRDTGRYLQIARWFFPFINWYAKAPKMAARALIERPGRVMGIERGFEGLAGDPTILPSEKRAEKGSVVPLTSRGEEVISQLTKAIGGKGERQGQTYLRTRSPVPEALAPIVELMKSNILPTVEQLGPLPQSLLAATGLHPLTGQQIEPGLDTGAGFALTSAVPSAIASRPMQLVYNAIASELMGGPKAAAPVAPFGPFPTATTDLRGDQVRNILATLLGASTFTARPQDRLQEILREVAPKIQNAKKAFATAKERKMLQER